MNGSWTCPACGFVGMPINQNDHMVCFNCKSDKVVPQNSDLGRQIAANHGLKIPAHLTRSK